MVATGATPFLRHTRDAFAQASGEAAVLEAAVRLEQRAELAYTTAVDSGALGTLEPLVRLLAEQEAEHAAGLSRLLRAVGGRPPPKPEHADEVPGLAEALTADSGNFALFALELEAGLVAAYHEAFAKLESRRPLQTVTSIVANEAQHLVVLRAAQGSDPSAGPFVPGER